WCATGAACFLRRQNVYPRWCYGQGSATRLVQRPAQAHRRSEIRSSPGDTEVENDNQGSSGIHPEQIARTHHPGCPDSFSRLAISVGWRAIGEHIVIHVEFGRSRYSPRLLFGPVVARYVRKIGHLVMGVWGLGIGLENENLKSQPRLAQTRF